MKHVILNVLEMAKNSTAIYFFFYGILTVLRKTIMYYKWRMSVLYYLIFLFQLLLQNLFYNECFLNETKCLALWYTSGGQNDGNDFNFRYFANYFVMRSWWNVLEFSLHEKYIFYSYFILKKNYEKNRELITNLIREKNYNHPLTQRTSIHWWIFYKYLSIPFSLNLNAIF